MSRDRNRRGGFQPSAFLSAQRQARERRRAAEAAHHESRLETPSPEATQDVRLIASPGDNEDARERLIDASVRHVGEPRREDGGREIGPETEPERPQRRPSAPRLETAEAEAPRAETPPIEAPRPTPTRRGGPNRLSDDELRNLYQSHWNAMAGRYAAAVSRAASQIGPHVLERAALRPGEALLDICCGPGALAGAAEALGVVATGVDFAPAMIASARDRFPRVEFRIGDAEALDVRADAYDIVTSTFGLTQMAQPESGLREALRAMAPGGRLILTHWASEAELPILRAAFEALAAVGIDVEDFGPVVDFAEPGAAEAVLEQIGFASVEIERIDARISVPRGEALETARMLSSRLSLALDQTGPEHLSRVANAIDAAIDRQGDGGRVEIAAPALLITARRPGDAKPAARAAAEEPATVPAREATADAPEPAAPRPQSMERLWASAARRRTLGDRPSTTADAPPASAAASQTPPASPSANDDGAGWRPRSAFAQRVRARLDAEAAKNAEAKNETARQETEPRPSAPTAPRRKPAFGLVRRILDKGGATDGDDGPRNGGA